MAWLNLFQWPAMAVTVLGCFWSAMCSGSSGAGKNGAYALIVLQLFFAGLNIRGAIKSRKE